MTDFTILVAGKTVAVSAMYETTRDCCRDYLTEAEADFSVTITPADIAFEQEKSAREDEVEGIPYREFSDAYLETIAVQRKIAEEFFDHDILVFHGSVIAADGVGYLFTAKSGTGKSTHTRLWREMLGDRAVMVNDDKPFLAFTPEGVMAYGSPWNGKHNLGCNIRVPLKAVCVLERGEKNTIRQIPIREALFMLLQQSNRPRRPDRMPKYMELIDALANGINFYRLQCTMDPEAAETSFGTMSADPWKT